MNCTVDDEHRSQLGVSWQLGWPLLAQITVTRSGGIGQLHLTSNFSHRI